MTHSPIPRLGRTRPPVRGRSALVGLMVLVPLVALVGAACGSTATTTTTTTGPASTVSSPSSTVKGTVPSTLGGKLGPEAVPIPDGPVLGPVNSSSYGQTIDGIECQTNEQAVYHIHAHLAVFVDGNPRQVPLGIGIGPPLQLQNTSVGPFVAGGSCFYWLHTHASDGVIHIESPTERQYTLGQFFDVWGQTLAAGQVGPATGTISAYVNGQIFAGDPRTITLGAHTLVQLDVGTVVPPRTLDWGPSQL